VPITYRCTGGPDLCPPVHRVRSIDTSGLGRHAAFHLRPLHERRLTVLRARSKLFVDDTTVRCSNPRAHQDRPALCLRANDRPWGD
jgi:hypothetical protein